MSVSVGFKDSNIEHEETMGDEELVHICASPQTSQSKPNVVLQSLNFDDFDVCKSYGYCYEYTENHNEDDIAEDQTHNAYPGFISRLIKSDINNYQECSQDSTNDTQYQIYCLGKIYHPVHDYPAKRDDEMNLFWFTYRCDFQEIKPYGITSDAGWGCMLRSAQMLIAQALRMHYCGRNWRAPQAIIKRREDRFIQDLMTWLADFPSSDTGSWYSLHNMVAAGLVKYDVLPGEWFGPGISCHVLRDLSELHDHECFKSYGQEKLLNPLNTNLEMNGYSGRRRVFKIYVASEGTIYRSDIQDLVAHESMVQSISTSQKMFPSNDFFHPLSDTLLDEPSQARDCNTSLKWDRSLLILIPLRLGLKSFNTIYKTSLAYMLSLPQSVGFLGGSPRHALWFYGANSDGSKVYGLDPHTVQRAPCRRRLHLDESKQTSNHKTHQVLLTDQYLRSINCPYVSPMDMTKIDPSLALGFYIRDELDFEKFCCNIQSSNKMNPEMFVIANKRPDYTADLDMMDMMNDGQDDGIMNYNSTHGSGNEDDYVLI